MLLEVFIKTRERILINAGEAVNTVITPLAYWNT